MFLFFIVARAMQLLPMRKRNVESANDDEFLSSGNIEKRDTNTRLANQQQQKRDVEGVLTNQRHVRASSRGDFDPCELALLEFATSIVV